MKRYWNSVTQWFAAFISIIVGLLVIDEKYHLGQLLSKELTNICLKPQCFNTSSIIGFGIFATIISFFIIWKISHNRKQQFKNWSDNFLFVGSASELDLQKHSPQNRRTDIHYVPLKRTLSKPWSMSVERQQQSSQLSHDAAGYIKTFEINISHQASYSVVFY